LQMEQIFGIAHLVQQSLSIPVAVQLHRPFFANGLEARLLREPEARQRIELEGVAIAAADGIAAPSPKILERTRAHYELPLAGAMVSPRPAPVVTQERRCRLANSEAVRYCSSAVSATVGANSRFPSTWPKTRRRSLPGSRPMNQSRRRGKSGGRLDVLGRIPASEFDAFRSKPYLTVVPSRCESFGTEVLEAMAYGCPLLAVRAGAIPETAQDGTNGLLCLPDAEHLAASLRRLLENPTLAAQLGERAGDDASGRYHPESLARGRAEFHREIIPRDAAKRRRTA
jgi:hypothetical protein